MEKLKNVVAANLTFLRKQRGMTQMELAEKLNYSDKAVSKWERGESLPDLIVLKEIADLFGVTVDYLLQETHEEPLPHREKHGHNRRFIAGMSLLLVWLVAAAGFVIACLADKSAARHAWLAFVFAVPVTMIVWLIFNSLWFNKKRNFLIISLLMWTLLAAVFVGLISFGINVWLIFILGVPGQLIILLWSRLRTDHPRK